MIISIGLIGFPLTHSFSAKYFNDKFLKENIKNYNYNNYELSNLNNLDSLIKNNKNLIGFNVTIPYKESIMDYLDFIENDAHIVGAVNTVKIIRNGNHYKLFGYNTDIIGLEKDISSFQKKNKHLSALILGHGGSAKATAFVLRKLGICYQFVSRHKNNGFITYSDLTKNIIQQNHLIINTTPLGMFPEIDNCPNIPYKYISKSHFIYDLIYNPSRSKFLNESSKYTSKIYNGLNLLYAQADASWEIWLNKLY